MSRNCGSTLAHSATKYKKPSCDATWLDADLRQTQPLSGEKNTLHPENRRILQTQKQRLVPQSHHAQTKTVRFSSASTPRDCFFLGVLAAPKAQTNILYSCKLFLFIYSSNNHKGPATELFLDTSLHFTNALEMNDPLLGARIHQEEPAAVEKLRPCFKRLKPVWKLLNTKEFMGGTHHFFPSPSYDPYDLSFVHRCETSIGMHHPMYVDVVTLQQPRCHHSSNLAPGNKGAWTGPKASPFSKCFPRCICAVIWSDLTFLGDMDMVFFVKQLRKRIKWDWETLQYSKKVRKVRNMYILCSYLSA